MRITFDPDFDRGCWPGPLKSNPPRKAVIGEPWVGPMGLLDILETALGLGGLYPTSIKRAAALSATVRTTDGFWSRSAENDPIGVAETLLHWIDYLKFHGWDGRPFSAGKNHARLNDLAVLASTALPDIPDRLSAILAALDKRRPEIESLTSFEPIDRLFPLWKSVLGRLSDRGVKISTAVPPSPASPTAIASNLRRALWLNFIPSDSKDDSLILLRSYGPMEAAEQLAAWLASAPSFPDTIIINPSVILDQAFRRFGLPTAGGREAVAEDPLLQILPLVLAMGWDPPDPQRALELLLIPEGPVPTNTAVALRSALQNWPAVGSGEWNRALAQTTLPAQTAQPPHPVPADTAGAPRPGRSSSSSSSSSPSSRTSPSSPIPSSSPSSVASRLQAIFKPDAKIDSPFPAQALLSRAALVKDWANARRFVLQDPQSELGLRFASIDRQCDLFARLVELSGLSAFTEPQILRLNLEISESISPARRYPAQFGLIPLPAPGAMAGPAPRVVWWDFAEDSAPSPSSLPLNRSELSALESRQIFITPPTELAADQSRRRRRPLEYASEQLVLVCPKFGEDGEERHPHPLWDEVSARIPKNASPAVLEKSALPASPRTSMRTDPPLPLPEPKRSWSVGAAAVGPKIPPGHSPSSLQSLLGCPFKWTLEKIARLGQPEIASLVDLNRLTGNLVHRILEETLGAQPDSPEKAKKIASELFETNGPRLAAPLFLPGSSVPLAIARAATAASAYSLVEHLSQARLRVIALEAPLSGELEDFQFNGRADLVAGEPKAVIDLKWSGETYHREQLKKGTALQLAFYAYLLKTGREFPPAAFFILRDQRLLALRGSPFKNALFIDGPPLEETWAALLGSMKESLEAVRNGKIDALGIPLDDDTPPIKEDDMVDGLLRLKPPCEFCSFEILCGRAWEESR